jgi:hypothetical protein
LNSSATDSVRPERLDADQVVITEGPWGSEIPGQRCNESALFL